MLLLTKSSLLFGKEIRHCDACLAGQSWLGDQPHPRFAPCWLAVNVYAYALMHMQPLLMSVMEHLRYADGKRIVSVGTVNLAKNIFIGCSD